MATEEAVATEEKEPAVEFEWNSVDDHAPRDPSASFADLNDDVEGTAIFAESSNEAQSGTSADEEGRRAALMLQELESVDFYINQGYTDIAADTLDLMQRQFGSNPEIDARRQKLKARTQGIAEESVAANPAVSNFEFGDVEQIVKTEEVAADLDFAFAGRECSGATRFSRSREQGNEAG